ncbi:tail fiber protein [Pedobacter sp. ASV1-7]|uniref:phage tail protein n=1 Tax=Pedobacter sp. ASV1-7 TaxID=3145237 RepID=UPI0032E8D004
MEGTIGEIRLFAGNFAPRTWAFCDGSLIAIQSNTALFSILGTTYGGNGQSTFGLPDLRGRVAVGTGQGPGLSIIDLGEVAGSENMTLTQNQMPIHTHSLKASNAVATSATPVAGSVLAMAQDINTDPVKIYSSATPNVDLGLVNTSVQSAGGSQPFSIRNPFLGMNYIICLYGIFPSRN